MMILDTNVLSELIRIKPDPTVVRWLNQQPAESVWTTSMTVFELDFGWRILPAGKRRNFLKEMIHTMLDEDLQNRVLDFDRSAAAAAAGIASELRTLGRPVDIRDVQIAGTVSARRAVLVTRNSRHFCNTGIELVDPWQS